MTRHFNRRPALPLRITLNLCVASAQYFASASRDRLHISDNSSSRFAISDRWGEGFSVSRWFANIPKLNDTANSLFASISYTDSKCFITTLSGSRPRIAKSNTTVRRRRSISAMSSLSFARRIAPSEIRLALSILRWVIRRPGSSQTHSIFKSAVSASAPRSFSRFRRALRFLASLVSPRRELVFLRTALPSTGSSDPAAQDNTTHPSAPLRTGRCTLHRDGDLN